MAREFRAGLIVAAGICCAIGCGPDSQERRGASVDDTSCLNLTRLFVNGATRVHPLFRMDLNATNDDWPELTRLLKEFAESRKWLFRDSSQSKPGVFKTLYVALCAPDQPHISIGEQRWASRNYAPLPTRAIGINFYGDEPEAVWQPVAVELVQQLERRWPNGVRFLDGDGYFVEPPDFLRKARPTSFDPAERAR